MFDLNWCDFSIMLKGGIKLEQWNTASESYMFVKLRGNFKNSVHWFMGTSKCFGSSSAERNFHVYHVVSRFLCLSPSKGGKLLGNELPGVSSLRKFISSISLVLIMTNSLLLIFPYVFLVGIQLNKWNNRRPVQSGCQRFSRKSFHRHGYS